MRRNLSTVSSHIGSKISFPQLVDAVRAEREPSDQALRFIVLALQHPNARDKGVVALLSQVDGWLRGKGSGQDCRQRFVQTGMPQALAGLLQRLGMWREEIAEEACAVIASAALQSKDIADAFVTSSALELICDCMTKHFENAGVQQSGLVAICAIAQHGVICRAGAGAKAKLVGSGVAANRLVQTMAAYPQLQDLQFFGCEALHHLVLKGEPPDDVFKEAATRAAEMHGKARAVIKASKALLEALDRVQPPVLVQAVEAFMPAPSSDLQDSPFKPSAGSSSPH